MKNLSSKKVMLSAVLMSTLAGAPILATASETTKAMPTAQELHQQQQDVENIGFGSGLLVGAVVAGPIGAFVGGIAGNFIAKHINAKDEVELLTENLAYVKESHLEQVSEYESKLARTEQELQTQLSMLEHNERLFEQLQAENLLMSLQFSTGSSDIAAHYQEQISALAQILNNAPDMKIDLSGYTDLAGEEEQNQSLSQARVASVKTLLMAQGVDEQQIQTFAYGEKSPVVANSEREVSFYDRRVVLKLHKPNSQMAQRN